MEEQKIRDIIDVDGNVLNEKNRIYNFKKKIKNNIWNILGIGVGACVTLLSSIGIIISTSYARKCSIYYGIDKRYFSGTDYFKDKVIFLFLAIIVFAHPLLFNFLNQKLRSKIYVIITFFAAIYFMFWQNLIYTIYLRDKIPYDWLKHVIDNYVMIFVFLASDVIISFYLIIRKYFWEKKPLKKFERILLFIALCIYFIDSFIGIGLALSSDISEKKEYEVINESKVIIATYEEKFIVMDCRIIEDGLYIKKGKYSFVDITDVEIKYTEYKKVICE